MKTAIVCVTNDLTTDQRVDRICTTLSDAGFAVRLVGRTLPDSMPLGSRPYKTFRLRLIFRKGPLFYAEYNLSLFVHLLFRKAELIVSNDTDTLPAAYLASRIKGTKHLHDCHEYFTGVPELVGRPGTVSIWKWFENVIFPRLGYITAVNASIAGLYEQEYSVPVKVMRNVPFRKGNVVPVLRNQYNIPGDTGIILYQGAVNIDRGLEEAIIAMKHITMKAVLVIIGTGDIVGQLRLLIRDEKVEEKVILTGQIPFDELHRYTSDADLGLSVEKNKGINYFYCLPNKLLDYIQAHVPVLVSPFPEMKQIVDTYMIGEYIESHDPERLSQQLERILKNKDALDTYRKNTLSAAEDLCWENEKQVLLGILETIK